MDCGDGVLLRGVACLGATGRLAEELCAGWLLPASLDGRGRSSGCRATCGGRAHEVPGTHRAVAVCPLEHVEGSAFAMALCPMAG